MPHQSTTPPTIANEPELPVGETLEDLLNWLNTLPPSGRTAEEIEARIREERDAWGD